MIPTFADAIAATAQTQPLAAYRALEGLVRQTVGADLFTVMMHDPARSVVWRSYSSRPDAFPVSGESPLLNDRWSQIVVKRGHTFVANSIAEFADVLAHHEQVRALGCESCMNVPIVIAGEFRAVLNCLSVAGHYTPDRVAAAETLKLPGAAVVMLSDAMTRRRADGIPPCPRG